MKKKIILVGGGGHAHSCVELIEQEKKYSIYGIVDLKKPISKILNNYEYLGKDEKLNEDDFSNLEKNNRPFNSRNWIYK